MTALERIARALAAQHWRDAGASEEQVLAFADIDWPEFVPDARAALTALREPDEAIVFSWVTWPSKKVRDEAWKALMEDPEMPQDMPFDGKRLIYGGFALLMHA